MRSHQALKHYKQEMIQGEIASAEPNRMIQLLLEDAMSHISLAEQYMEEQKIPEKGSNIGMAISIVGCLQASLNFDSDGPSAEIVKNLDSLYDYIKVILVRANLHNNIEQLKEVYLLLSEIKVGWDAIVNSEQIDN